MRLDEAIDCAGDILWPGHTARETRPATYAGSRARAAGAIPRFSAAEAEWSARYFLEGFEILRSPNLAVQRKDAYTCKTSRQRGAKHCGGKTSAKARHRVLWLLYVVAAQRHTRHAAKEKLPIPKKNTAIHSTSRPTPKLFRFPFITDNVMPDVHQSS